MGARCNFIFKQSENQAVCLYSHWGEYTMHEDLAAALKHAEPRYGDIEYYTRMAISYLIKDDILDETGFGISAINPNNLGYLDQPILIDLINNTISDSTGFHYIDAFIDYYLKSLPSGSILSTVGAS